MVLRSQVARQGIRWRYMAGGSRRRGVRRWPWALLSLLILAGVGWFIWQGSHSTSGVAADGVDADVAQDDQTSAGADGTQASTAGGSGFQLPPPGDGNRRSTGQSRAAAGSSSQSLPADRVWTLDGSPLNDPSPASSSASTPGVASPTGTIATAGVAGASPVTSADGTQGGSASSASSASSGATASTATPSGGRDIETGFSLIEQGRRVEGRKLLSKLLLDGALTPAQAQKTRDVLTNVSYMMIYTPRYFPNDPLTEQYTVKRGDVLVNIAIDYKTPHQFIEKINGINANRIQLDQKLKVVRGPFHAVVSKSAFRMDVYLKDPSDGQLIYIRSFPVGLGADDSTPLGQWVVKPRSKVVNPAWTNPRTHEHYQRDDPANPIGEFWMALEGVSSQTAGLSGYGIHGTIEPQSIGTQSSMGCIRLRDEDIAQVYHMFWEGETTVKIIP